MASRKELQIDGVTVFIKKFPPFTSVAVLGDLQKHLLGPMGSLVSFGGDQKKMGGLTADLSEYAVERAIEKVSSGLDGETLMRLARKLIDPEYVSILLPDSPDGKAVKATEGVLATAFDEDPFGGIVQLFTECVKVNYLGFFTRAQTLFGRGQQAETPTE